MDLENRLLGSCVLGYRTGRAYVTIYSKNSSNGNTDNASVIFTAHFLYALCIHSVI